MNSLYLLQGYGSIAGLSDVWEVLGWNAIALLAVLICLFFFTIIYMFGRALSLESVKRWAASEYMQVVASGILIIFLVNLVNFGTTVAIGYLIGQGSTAVCGGNAYAFEITVPAVGGMGAVGASPISFARCRIQEKITELETKYRNLFKTNLKTEAAAQTCYSFAGVQVYCGDWYLHGDVEKAHLLAAKITPLVINLHAQYSLLDYLEQNMLTIFLPIGIVLRTLPLTRGAGGLFIAVALGFYFLFPAFFVITDPSFVRGSEEVAVSEDEVMVFNNCYPGFSGTSVLLDEVNDAQSINAGRMNIMSSELANLTVGIVFYPFLALALTLVFIRTMIPIFGGDAGELARMVSKVI